MKLDCLLIIILLLCTEITSFQWTSDLQDGADVYACIGDSVTLPWGYTAQDGERVENIKWYFDQQNGSNVGIAVTMEGQFFALTTPFSNRIRQVEEAGLLITSLTGSDRGNYFVTATVLRGSTFATYNSTVSLRLSENVLVHQSEALWARQERVAVYDNKTGQLHVQLSCGGYVITGHPPLSVEWTFPSGKTQLVSTHINGTFFLSVPNPIQGGNYVCRLSTNLPPLSCLPQNSSVFGSSSVTVDEVKMRLSLLEGEQEMIRTEKQVLLAEVDRLREENRKLSETTSSQQKYLQGVRRVMFDVRPSESKYFNAVQRLVFNHVITNEGNAYDVNTGVFTAPFNGTYFFVLTVAQRVTYSPGVSLADDVTTFCKVLLQSFINVGFTCDATVYRAQGQQLWIRTNGELSLSSPYSSFSGFSLNSDISTQS